MGAQLRTGGTEEKGWAYLAEIVAGEGTGGDLGTWAAAAGAQTSSLERERTRLGPVWQYSQCKQRGRRGLEECGWGSVADYRGRVAAWGGGDSRVCVRGS